MLFLVLLFSTMGLAKFTHRDYVTRIGNNATCAADPGCADHDDEVEWSSIEVLLWPYHRVANTTINLLASYLQRIPSVRRAGILHKIWQKIATVMSAVAKSTVHYWSK